MSIKVYHKTKASQYYFTKQKIKQGFKVQNTKQKVVEYKLVNTGPF